ncbi:hypothetical protein F442_05366 [Phytophthora nicotianae P10297]|uniref:Uncharacterized protein n=1 Tax=Phytophthora nicotianae P10297 TaxID=1317064 RepID=W2ZNM5_PHYNI|nr:hypothetical protein F442_05366 [Phytophthora nicotianae P10297]
MFPLDEVDAQYERIVRLIPVEELQSSYNSVLHVEFSSVNNAVDGIVAVLSHLKEVRNAVTKLEKYKPQRSLTKTMDRTLELRRELEIKLQRVTHLMEAASVNSKSQRYEQIGCSASTVVDNEESESESSSDSDSGSSSESEDEDVSIDPRRRFLLQHTKDVENDVGNCAGGLFTGRNKLVSDLEKENAAVADNGGRDNVVIATKTSTQYIEMMEKVDRMAVVERYSHIRDVLREMTDVVNKYGKEKLHKRDVGNMMIYALRWLSDCTNQKKLVDAYEHFLTAVKAFEGQLLEPTEKSLLKGLSTKFSRLLSQLSIPENGNDEPEEANLEESKPKHDGPIPTEQLNKARGRSEMVTSERTPLLSKPLNAAANEKCAPLVRSAGPPPKKLPAYYAIMLNDVKQVPIQLRAPCVSHALLLLKKAMMTDAVGEQKADISDSIGGVLDWITESSDLEHDFELYHDFAIVLFSYTLQHPETEELQRITDQFSETIDKIRSEGSSTQAAEPVPHRVESKYLDTHKRSAATAIAEEGNSDTRQGEGGVSNALGGNAVSKYEAEVGSESESDSESDYEDEKEAVGGSEAAWNALMATVSFDNT